MEPLHISERDLAKDVRSILQRVETGAEVIVERDAHPVAVIRPAEPVRRQLLESVALKTGDDGIAVSVVTVLELAHGITRADTPSAATGGSASLTSC